MRLVWKSGAWHFGVVFAFGFAFGIVRTLWALPRFGERNAELLETPLMLIVIALTSRRVSRRLGDWKTRLQAGGIGLALLLGVEIVFVLRLRGLTLGDYVSQRDPVSGAVYLVMLAIFAVAPALWGLWTRSEP